MTREETCLKLYNLVIAEKGVHETPGPAATARILEYKQHSTLKSKSDEEAWCSDFANFITDTAGFPGTHSAAAISWANWGVRIPRPILGCLVLMKRHDPSNPNARHITFCTNEDISNNVIQCTGGNQHDMVDKSRFPVANVECYISPV